MNLSFSSIYKNKGFSLLVLCLFCISGVFPQSKMKKNNGDEEEVQVIFEMACAVEHAERPLKGAKVELKNGEEIVETIITTKNGRAVFKRINYKHITNHQFKMIVSMPGMVSKTVEINTFIPEKDLAMLKKNSKGDEEIFNFEPVIPLFVQPSTDVVLVNPVAKFKWIGLGAEDKFSFDARYAQLAKKEETMFLADPKKYADYIKKQQAKKEAKEQEQKAKNAEAFDLSGRVTFNKQPLAGVKIETLEDGQTSDTKTTGNDGKYMPPIKSANHVYTIIFSKDAFVTRSMEVNTTIPADVLRKLTAEGGAVFKMEMGEMPLFPAKTYEIILGKPSLKIYWNNKAGRFVIDEEYRKKVMAEEELYRTNPELYSLQVLGKKPPSILKKEQEALEKAKQEEEEQLRANKTRKAEETRSARENMETKQEYIRKVEEAVNEMQTKDKEAQADNMNAAKMVTLSKEDLAQKKNEAEQKGLSVQMKTDLEQKTAEEEMAIKEEAQEEEITKNKETKYGGDNPLMRMLQAKSEFERQQKKQKVPTK